MIVFLAMMDRIVHNLLYFMVKALHFSFRYKYLNRSILKDAEALSKNQNYIFAVWHQNLVSSITAHIDRNYVVIVSPSKDGEYVSRLCTRLKLTPVRGSSSRGGKEGLGKMVHLMNRGLSAAITVDGPKGPPKKAKFGVLELSKLTGAPIIPMYTEASGHWTFKKSWDKFRFPKPFSKIKVKYGEPILIAGDTERDAFYALSERLEEALLKLEE